MNFVKLSFFDSLNNLYEVVIVQVNTISKQFIRKVSTKDLTVIMVVPSALNNLNLFQQLFSYNILSGNGKVG